MNTKSSIIKQAVYLFNKKGFFNVSINDIAQAMGISPGNFTYHFKRKEHLLAAIQEEVLDNAIEIFPKDEYVTLFHFQELFTQFYGIQKKYRFFFMDILYLIEEYPDIMNQYQLATSKRFEDARRLINYYIDSDRLVSEEERVNYDLIIRTLWMTSTFWSAGTTLLDKKNMSMVEDSPLQTLWEVLKPYLTDKGYNEYLEITQNAKQKQIRT